MTTARTETSAPRRLDGRMRASIASVALVGAGFALVTLVVFGMSAALSVAVGAAIAAGNLWALARIIAALLPDDAQSARSQNKAAWALLAVLKMFGLIVAVWLLMRHGVVSPLPMMVGFGSLPIGIAIGSLVSDRRSR
jgi:ATP synthase I chain